jgi:hypothetical protein
VSLTTGHAAYIQGTLEVDGGARVDSTLTMGAANSFSAVPWTNTNLATSTNTYAVRAMQAYGGYLYAGKSGGSAGDGDIQMCDPALAGSTTICDSASDWTRVLDNASASSVTSMVSYKNRLYASEGNGTGTGTGTGSGSGTGTGSGSGTGPGSGSGSGTGPWTVTGPGTGPGPGTGTGPGTGNPTSKPLSGAGQGPPRHKPSEGHHAIRRQLRPLPRA